MVSVTTTNELILNSKKPAVTALMELLITLYDALMMEIGVIPVILLPMHAAMSKLPFFFAMMSIEPWGSVVGGVMIVFTRNWMPEYVLLATKFATVTSSDVGLVTIEH